MKKIFICCGINRSGSTWVYQIMQEALSKKSLADIGFVDKDFTKVYDALESSSEIILFKMHSFSNELVSLFEEYDYDLIYSHRDLRACMYSLMQKTDKSFEEVLAMPFFNESVNSFSKWKKYSPLYLSYDMIMNDNIKAVNLIFDRLGYTSSDLDKVVEKYSMKSQQKRIQEFNNTPSVRLKILLHRLRLKPMPKNEKNLLHFNHIQNGSIDKWKSVFTVLHSEMVESRFDYWMKFFKYS